MMVTLGQQCNVGEKKKLIVILDTYIVVTNGYVCDTGSLFLPKDMYVWCLGVLGSQCYARPRYWTVMY